VAEYRALRASVLRQWMDACGSQEIDLDDIVRFNEAVDQALSESIAFFSAQVDQARNLLLGMLGHDMRSPLNTILMTATYLNELNAGANVSSAASRLISSGASMKALLDDLVDFNRTKLGLGINVILAPIDMEQVFVDELEQIRGANPDHAIELEVVGNTQGRWDRIRMQQLLRNLVINAIKHGSPDAPVRVLMDGKGADLRIEITNNGPTMEQSALSLIFNPLKKGPTPENSPMSNSGLGLGLYIVREIARSHGGEVDVRSDSGETVFSVRLPRGNEATSPRESSAL